ncbi:hypothetical protein FAVG1_01176 [Fusarium avenaceum]|nr:hypothetical protein FAVG1_01176 [Fusarium avenaceum]
MAAASHHFQASVTLPFSPTAGLKYPVLLGQAHLSTPTALRLESKPVLLQSHSIDMDVCGAVSLRNKNHPMEQKISEHRALDTQAFVTCQDSQTRPLRLSFSRTVTGVSGVTGALTQHPGGVSGGVVFVKKTPEPGRVAMGFDALVQATSKPIRLRCLSER